MNRTKIKYLKKSDNNRYFIDKLKLNHWFIMDSELIPFKRNSFYIAEKKTKVIFKREGLSTRIIFNSYHNPNRLIRFWGIRKFNLTRTGSEFSHNDNFIPYNLRRAFIREDYTYTVLREKVAELLFQEVLAIQDDIRKRVWGEHYSKFLFSGIEVQHSIGEIEVCYDIESVAPLEFSNQVSLKERFQRAADETSMCQFNPQGQSRFADTDLGISNVRGGTKNGRNLIEALLNDDSKLKVYTKEIAKCRILNRIERRLGKDQIRKYGSNTFSAKSEFIGLINQIAHQTFKLISPIMNIPISFDDENVKRIIWEFCKNNYGRHFDDAYNDFTTGGCFVGTGKNGNSKTAVKHKTLKICREGGPIRKDQRGKYVLDLHKIKSARSLFRSHFF